MVRPTCLLTATFEAVASDEARWAVTVTGTGIGTLVIAVVPVAVAVLEAVVIVGRVPVGWQETVVVIGFPVVSLIGERPIVLRAGRGMTVAGMGMTAGSGNGAMER